MSAIGPGTTELAPKPLGRPMTFIPSQFAMLFMEGKSGWRRHPFTMSGAPDDGVLRFTIKALGDDTGELQDLVQPGMPAVVSGPHGRFQHTRGTRHQIWIAGGIGITPFLSWLRALESHPLAAQVDFYYSTDGPAPFAAEITQIAATHPNLGVHFRDSRTDGRITPTRSWLAHLDPRLGCRSFSAARPLWSRASRRDSARPECRLATSTASTSTGVDSPHEGSPLISERRVP